MAGYAATSENKKHNTFNNASEYFLFEFIQIHYHHVKNSKISHGHGGLIFVTFVATTQSQIKFKNENKTGIIPRKCVIASQIAKHDPGKISKS